MSELTALAKEAASVLEKASSSFNATIESSGNVFGRNKETNELYGKLLRKIKNNLETELNRFNDILESTPPENKQTF